MVEYYFKHYASLNMTASQSTHIFAYVKWFSAHPNQPLFGYPVEVWCNNVFDLPGPSSIIPFNRIHSLFVGGLYKHNDERVLCVCPTK